MGDAIGVAIKSGYLPEFVVSWRGGRFRNESKVPLSVIDNVAVLMTIVRTISGVGAG